MNNMEFYELFYSKLEKELGNEKFTNSLKELMINSKFTRKSYEKLLEEELDE